MVRARKITITDVLMEYYSEYNWAVLGENYSDIVWNSDESHKPTESDINGKITGLRNAEPMRFLREERNRRIVETNWWVLPDRNTSQEQLDYRQALRDLPATSEPRLDEQGNLVNVTWPTKLE